MKINGVIFILLILGCNTVFYAQSKGFDLISAAHMTQSPRGSQTVGLPMSTTTVIQNSHFYGFEQAFISLDQTISKDEFNFKIYPNPFNEIFTVEPSSQIEAYTLKVYTLDQIELPVSVFQTDSKLTVHLESNQTGILLAYISINNKTAVRKIIRTTLY